MSGIPMGIMIVPPIVQQIEAMYGWRGTLLLSGGICSNLCACAMVMKPSVLEKQTQSRNVTSELEMNPETWTVVSTLSRSAPGICDEIRNILLLLSNRNFVFFWLTGFLRCLAGSIVSLHLPNFALHKENTPEDISHLFLALGSGSIFGRLLTGVGTNHKEGRPGLDMFAITHGSLGIAAMASCLLPFYSSTKVGLLVYACMFGLYYGVFSALMNPLTAAVVGLHRLITAYSVFMLAVGFGCIAGPPLGSWFHDITGSYEWSFVLSGLLLMAASLLFLGVPRRPEGSNQNGNEEEDKSINKDMQ